MNISATLFNLPKGQIFNKTEFRKAVHSTNPDCTEASINWMLITLRKQGILASAGTGKYYTISPDTPMKKNYQYPHSSEYLEIEDSVLKSILCRVILQRSTYAQFLYTLYNMSVLKVLKSSTFFGDKIFL